MAYMGLYVVLMAVLAHGAWIRPESLDVIAKMTPPPARGSELDRSDYDTILRYQHSRSDKDCHRAISEVSVSLERFYGAPYGPLTAAEVKALAPFFEKILHETDAVVQKAKTSWARPRPYVADARVSPCVRREVTDAYPSGHAAIAVVFARVLSRIYPERAVLFERRAQQIGNDRVLAGVHHPSDIKAGNRLGEEIFQAMATEKPFKGQLKKHAQASRPLMKTTAN